MYKLKKKVMAIVLSLAMLISILPTNVALAAEVEGVSEENASAAAIEEEDSNVQEVGQETQAEEEVQAVEEPKLQYLYVDNPYITTPDTQKIMVSFQEGVELDAVSLVYENVETKEQYEVQAGEIQDAAAVFSIECLEERLSGIYHLLNVRIVTGDVTNQINLDEIGIVSQYGVNKECETEPDAVVEEQDATSKTRAVNEPGTSANILTYDISGELVESESVEEVVAEASQSVQTSKARTVAESEKPGNLIVVLDPGHGGFDSGAIGVNNAREKDLTLKIAQYCKEELEQYGGVTVYMTRTADTNVGGATDPGDSLAKRVEYAKEKNADILVSLHLNAVNKSAHGAEVYYPNSNYDAAVGSEGKNLAQKIQNELVGLGLSNRGIHIKNSANNSTYPDGSLQDYYGLIRQSKRAGFPAIIVEHAFIDNMNDYNQYLSSDVKLQALGIADATGIAAAYGLSKGKWVLDNKGWQYQYADGSYVESAWARIGGSWYHFDKNGYMQTGWFTEGSAKYYLDPVNGDMKTGWQLLQNKWYYFNGSGVMVTGWQWVGNVCYTLTHLAS